MGKTFARPQRKESFKPGTYRVTWEVPPTAEDVTDCPSAEDAKSEIEYKYGPNVRVTRVDLVDPDTAGNA